MTLRKLRNLYIVEQFIRSLVIMKIETTALSDRNISSKQTSSTVDNLVPATRDLVYVVVFVGAFLHWKLPAAIL